MEADALPIPAVCPVAPRDPSYFRSSAGTALRAVKDVVFFLLVTTWFVLILLWMTITRRLDERVGLWKVFVGLFRRRRTS